MPPLVSCAGARSNPTLERQLRLSHRDYTNHEDDEKIFEEGSRGMQAARSCYKWRQRESCDCEACLSGERVRDRFHEAGNGGHFEQLLPGAQLGITRALSGGFAEPA